MSAAEIGPAGEIRVSVCIPTCNRPEMLRQCIESALAQTMPPFEIVVGDDSRDDRSERVVAELTGFEDRPRSSEARIALLGARGRRRNWPRGASPTLAAMRTHQLNDNWANAPTHEV